MKVHGVYTGEVAAATAIQELNAMGYEKSAIRVVAGRHLGEEFDTVETVEATDIDTRDDDNRGLFAKIRNFFSFSKYNDAAYDKMDADTRSILKTYRSNLDNGEIVILIKDDGRSSRDDSAEPATNTAGANVLDTVSTDRDTGTPLSVEPKPDPALTREEEEMLDVRPEDRNR